MGTKRGVFGTAESQHDRENDGGGDYGRGSTLRGFLSRPGGYSRSRGGGLAGRPVYTSGRVDVLPEPRGQKFESEITWAIQGGFRATADNFSQFSDRFSWALNGIYGQQIYQNIYFLQSEAQPANVKIGRTGRRLKARIAALQTGSPVPLRLILCLNGIRQLEPFFHLVFAEYRVHGEWFEPRGRLKEFIADCLKDNIYDVTPQVVDDQIRSIITWENHADWDVLRIGVDAVYELAKNSGRNFSY